MSQLAPLVARHATDPIAFITQHIDSLDGYRGVIHAETFLSHVHSLAQQLPVNTHIINLCGNRYLFMVSICAAMLRKQINLLPPNKNVATQQRLSQRYADAYVLHDGIDVDEGIPSLNLQHIKINQTSVSAANNVDIPLDQLALISFTSGSTGDSQPNHKTWLTLNQSTSMNRRYMLPEVKQLYYVLATVPGQHMWGLETSVLMALFTDTCVVDAKPLFPSDISEALNMLPEPRVVVSTPVHLRALSASGLAFPNVDVVLCATSPLTDKLAQQVEALFDAHLHEVYGCSEVGSMAIRKTAHDQRWLKFDGISFIPAGQKTSNIASNTIVASTQYLDQSIELSDQIELYEDGYFRLLGRSSDMVDIAGKRGSLAEINKVLLTFEGLLDGIVIFPQQERAVPRLAAIVSLKDGYSAEQLKTHFRKYLDGVFVPRPIFYVEQLPREENGKLARKKVDALYTELTQKKN